MIGLLSRRVITNLHAQATLAALCQNKPPRYQVLLRYGEVWQDWTEWDSDALPVVVSTDVVRTRLCAYYVGRLEMELHAGRGEKEAMVALAESFNEAIERG